MGCGDSLPQGTAFAGRNIGLIREGEQRLSHGIQGPQPIEALATTGRPHTNPRETPEKAEIAVEDNMGGVDKIDHALPSLRVS